MLLFPLASSCRSPNTSIITGAMLFQSHYCPSREVSLEKKKKKKQSGGVSPCRSGVKCSNFADVSHKALIYNMCLALVAPVSPEAVCSGSDWISMIYL